MSSEDPDVVAVLQRRGGGELGFLPWSTYSWSRVLDDMSDASIEVAAPSSPSTAVAQLLAKVTPWEHELAIVEDGTERWVGPVTQPAYQDTGITIPARDVTQWFERRSLPFDRNFTNADVAFIYAQLVVDAMSGDDSPGIAVDPVATGVETTQTVDASTHPRAADELRNLAGFGLDYTAIGRRILVGGTEVPTRRLPPLTNDNLSKPVLRPDGLQAADEVTVIGSSSGGSTSPHVATVGGFTDRLGLVQQMFNESGIEDDRSAATAARTRWDMLHEVPEYLTAEVDMRRGPGLDVLIPGAIAPVEVLCANCRWVVGDMRLRKVTVSGSSGDNASRSVEVELVPVGTVEGR